MWRHVPFCELHAALRSQDFRALPHNRRGFRRLYILEYASLIDEFFNKATELVPPLCAQRRHFHRFCIPIVFRTVDIPGSFCTVFEIPFLKDCGLSEFSLSKNFSRRFASAVGRRRPLCCCSTLILIVAETASVSLLSIDRIILVSFQR